MPRQTERLGDRAPRSPSADRRRRGCRRSAARAPRRGWPRPTRPRRGTAPESPRPATDPRACGSDRSRRRARRRARAAASPKRARLISGRRREQQTRVHRGTCHRGTCHSVSHQQHLLCDSARLNSTRVRSGTAPVARRARPPRAGARQRRRARAPARDLVEHRAAIGGEPRADQRRRSRAAARRRADRRCVQRIGQRRRVESADDARASSSAPAAAIPRG